MVKKDKVKQKQKQSQKTSVVVNVGTKKTKSSRRKTASTSSVARTPSISVVLQGSSMSLPQAPTQQYNDLVTQLENIRREQAQSGSLIARIARNDMFNRVTETNPFKVASTNTQANMVDPYEGLVEEQVEASTTQDAYVDGVSGEFPIDQDFIHNVNLEKISPSLGGTVKKLNFYDDENLEVKMLDEIDKIEKGISKMRRRRMPERMELSGYESSVSSMSDISDMYDTPQVRGLTPRQLAILKITEKNRNKMIDLTGDISSIESPIIIKKEKTGK